MAAAAVEARGKCKSIVEQCWLPRATLNPMGEPSVRRSASPGRCSSATSTGPVAAVPPLPTCPPQETPEVSFQAQTQPFREILEHHLATVEILLEQQRQRLENGLRATMEGLMVRQQGLEGGMQESLQALAEPLAQQLEERLERRLQDVIKLEIRRHLEAAATPCEHGGASSTAAVEVLSIATPGSSVSTPPQQLHQRLEQRQAVFSQSRVVQVPLAMQGAAVGVPGLCAKSPTKARAATRYQTPPPSALRSRSLSQSSRSPSGRRGHVHLAEVDAQHDASGEAHDWAPQPEWQPIGSGQDWRDSFAVRTEATLDDWYNDDLPAEGDSHCGSSDTDTTATTTTAESKDACRTGHGWILQSLGRKVAGGPQVFSMDGDDRHSTTFSEMSRVEGSSLTESTTSTPMRESMASVKRATGTPTRGSSAESVKRVLFDDDRSLADWRTAHLLETCRERIAAGGSL